MAKKLLGLVLAILMAVPTTAFAQDGMFAAVRSEVEGARLRLVLDGGREIRATLVRVDADAIVIRDVKAGPQLLALRRPDGGENGTALLPRADVRSVSVLKHSPAQLRETAGKSNAEVVRLKLGRVGLGKQVKVWPSSDGWRVGELVMLGVDSFGVRTPDGQETIAYGDVRALEVHTPAGWGQALKIAGVLYLSVGTVVGVAVMAMLAHEH